MADSDRVEHDELWQRLKQLLALPQNRLCSDCSMVGPTWASKNIGVFVCLDCAGVHRSMGTDISQVRSVDLDSWTPAWVAVMERVGNAIGNSCYEARMPPGKKISPSVSKDARSAFIREKYAKKAFYSPLSEAGAAAAAAPVLSAAEQRKQLRLARLNNNNSNNTNNVVSAIVTPVPTTPQVVILPVAVNQQPQPATAAAPVRAAAPLSLDLFSGMTVKTTQTPSNNSNNHNGSSNSNTLNLFEGMSISPSTPLSLSPAPSASPTSSSFDLLDMDSIVVQEAGFAYIQPVTTHVRQEDPFAEFITL